MNIFNYNDIANLIIQFIAALGATVCFAIYFNTPKNQLIKVGIIGGLGWVVYYLITYLYNSPVLATFISSCLIGAMSELFSTKFKSPATVYLLPGIITLVPGAGTYYTLKYIIDGYSDLAYKKGIETFGIAVAIAFGILITSLLSKPIRNSRKK